MRAMPDTQVCSKLSTGYFEMNLYSHCTRLKCNRESPCDACTKRGERSACKYANNANRTIKPKNSNVNERLQRVENLVSRLMEGGGPADFSTANIDFTDKTRASHTARDSVVHQIDAETPRRQQGGQLDTNWLSILDDIKEVREELSQSDIYTPEDNNEANDAPEVDLVFGPVGVADFQDILNSVPPRPICDKFLSEYFNAPFMLRMFLFIDYYVEANSL